MKTDGWQEGFEDHLAKAWPTFVDCGKRMATEGPFLRRILKGKQEARVLDAATGMGCEATWLLQEGFDVTANEYSPVMRRVASEHAAENGIDLHPLSYDWREFDSRFASSSFDAILLLGNSLCLLHEKTARVRVAQNLYRVCAPGGVLVVDERNFGYILNEQAQILEGRFRYSGRVMYCGEEVIGRPTSISPENVTFSYFERKSGALVGRLDMYPFKDGELRTLFEGCGFHCQSILYDLGKSEGKTADFYTYVFVKGQLS